jgi:thiol-disulfide isomerase/thioredoxin
MQQYQRVVHLLYAALLLLPLTAFGVPLPQGLQNVLRADNFNMYAVPCPANNMILQDIGGETVNLAALRGKVVILNFWKIDCPPCLSEKPVLDRIFRKYGRQGLEIISVNLFDDFKRVRSFAEKHRYGFTICGNPDGRFSTRKQPLPGGTSTTFVVNDRSEAIYEVPAVPTTYLIDRAGNVVGNSVGVVNWEDKPLGRLLECMLGPGEPNAAPGHQVFSDAAGQGHSPAPAVRTAGPTQRGAADSPQNGPSTAKHTFRSPRSTMQGKTNTGPDARKSSRVERPVSRQSPAPKPAPSLGPRRAERSSQPTPARPPRGLTNLQRQYSTPRQYTPRSSAPMTQRTPKPYVPSPGTAATSPAPYPSSRQIASPAETDRSPMDRRQPPLPVAIPYTPPRWAANPGAAQRELTPGPDGTVMARVQPYGSSGTTERQEPGGSSPVPGAPLAPPVAHENALQGLILDSFDGSAAPGHPQPLVRPVEPISPPHATETPPEQPAGSVLGQVSKDFWNLESGIGDALSRMWPGKQ